MIAVKSEREHTDILAHKNPLTIPGDRMRGDGV